MKKLKDTREALNIFLNNCSGLGKKLGPILFQLPPGWQLNLERLEEFLQILPKGYRYAFEFRNATWYHPEVYKLLKQYNCAFCIYQLAGHMSPIEVTADLVYLRLHGPTKNKYQGSYDFYTLRAWAEKSREWQRAGKDVFIYFDNDDSGYAAFNAQVIEMMLNKQEPVTLEETKNISLLIDAIRQQKQVTFTYASAGKKSKIVAAPYLLAIVEKGKGDLFFSADITAGKKSTSLEKFLLRDISQLRILETGIDIERAATFVENLKSSTSRILYRVVVKGKRKRQT